MFGPVAGVSDLRFAKRTVLGKGLAADALRFEIEAGISQDIIGLCPDAHAHGVAAISFEFFRVAIVFTPPDK